MIFSSPISLALSLPTLQSSSPPGVGWGSSEPLTLPSVGLHCLVPAKQLSCDLCRHCRCSRVQCLCLHGRIEAALSFGLLPAFLVCSGCLWGKEVLDFWDKPTDVQTMLIHIRCSLKQNVRYMSVLLHWGCSGSNFLILGKV